MKYLPPEIQNGVTVHPMQPSTLAEWAEGWLYRIRLHEDGTVSVPDSTSDLRWRVYAWDLEDYRVSSVTGGSIWFVPRKEKR